MKQYSKPFFLSDVMRMCRIPSGKIIKENTHAALRHNGGRLTTVKKLPI